MNNALYNNRQAELDLFKAFGIVLMVMGHIGFGITFDKWIHAFHMPIFFFISGVLYKKTSIKVLLVKRAKSLLMPYYIVGLLHCLIYMIKEHSINTEEPFVKLFVFNTVGGGYQ